MYSRYMRHMVSRKMGQALEWLKSIASSVTLVHLDICRETQQKGDRQTCLTADHFCHQTLLFPLILSRIYERLINPRVLTMKMLKGGIAQ